MEFFTGGVEAGSHDQLLPFFFFQAPKDFVQGEVLVAIFANPIHSKFIILAIITMFK